jgi:hypothetical protein
VGLFGKSHGVKVKSIGQNGGNIVKLIKIGFYSPVTFYNFLKPISKPKKLKLEF